MERIKEAVMRARALREEKTGADEQEATPGLGAAQAGAGAQTAPATPVTPAQVAPAQAALTQAVSTQAASTQAASTQAASTQGIPAQSVATTAPETPTGGQPGLPQTAVTGADLPATENAVAAIKYKQTRVVHLDPSQLERNRIISFSKSDARTVSFDRLRTQVLRTMRDYGWRTLAITSPTSGCGKTTVALNLAFSIAHQTEQTVLLADFDLRDPQVAEYLGLPEAASLVDYLNGDVPLSDVFVNPGIPRLTLLPNHKAVLNAAETLMTRKMKDMVNDIRDRYESRMVIFDLPPLLTTDDALAFLPQVDCVLLVVASGQSTKSEVRQAMNLLQDTEVLGSVLNKGEQIVAV